MSGSTTWTTHVNATPEAVFEPLGNLERHSTWSIKQYKATKTSEGPVGIGTTFDSFGWLPGKGKEYLNKVTITAYDPGKRLAFDATYEAGTVPSNYVLTSENGGTKVERTMSFTKPPGVEGVLWPVIFPLLVKPAIQKNLNMFKAAVENGTA